MCNEIESVVEEVYEIQSFQPFRGWTFERFADQFGETFSTLSEAGHVLLREERYNHHEVDLNLCATLSNRATPHTPPTLLDLERSNYVYDSKKHNLSYYEIGCLPNNDWMWSHAWMLDYEFLHVEWSYGTSIHGMNRRLAEGTNRTKKSLVDFLRRRRWIRTRIRKPCLEMEEFSEHSNENSSNHITLHVTEPEYSMSLSNIGQSKVQKNSKRHYGKDALNLYYLTLADDYFCREAILSCFS